jgi:hypothetical protein
MLPKPIEILYLEKGLYRAIYGIVSSDIHDIHDSIRRHLWPLVLLHTLVDVSIWNGLVVGNIYFNKRDNSRITDSSSVAMSAFKKLLDCPLTKKMINIP